MRGFSIIAFLAIGLASLADAPETKKAPKELRGCPEISVTTSQLVYTPVHATRKQGGCDTPTVRRSGFDVG